MHTMSCRSKFLVILLLLSCFKSLLFTLGLQQSSVTEKSRRALFQTAFGTCSSLLMPLLLRPSVAFADFSDIGKNDGEEAPYDWSGGSVSLFSADGRTLAMWARGNEREMVNGVTMYESTVTMMKLAGPSSEMTLTVRQLAISWAILFHFRWQDCGIWRCLEQGEWGKQRPCTSLWLH